jgi:hypothetical protein
MTEVASFDYTSHIESAKRAAGNFLESIRRAYLPPNAGAPAAFILLTCYIDFLGSLLAGKDASPTTFGDFVRRFISPSDKPSRYDPDDLYKSLRSKLVHNHAIWNARYYLTHGRPELHLKPVNTDGTVLNLEDFFQDVEGASRAYFRAVDSDHELQRKLASRLDKVGTLDDVQLVYDGKRLTAA